LYRVCASEGYFDVCLFENGDFSDFMSVVCEGGPFLGFVDGILMIINILRDYEINKSHKIKPNFLFIFIV
jgi:hypothetical protein